MSASQGFRDAMDHLAEIEFMEHHYGLDTHQREYPTLEELGVDNEPIEYAGYNHRPGDFADYDAPWQAYIPTIDWSDIPF